MVPPILSKATKLAPPFAGSAGRFTILDPVLVRSSPVDVIKTETTIMAIIDQINELKAELASCALTKKERIAAEAELATLIAEGAPAENRAAEAFFETLRGFAANPPR